MAINDLIATHGDKCPQGRDYLTRLDALEPALRSGAVDATRQWKTLQGEALLANPALNFERLLVVRRKHTRPQTNAAKQDAYPWLTLWAGGELGLPSNHECNQSVRRVGWENQIATFPLKQPASSFTTVFRPSDTGWVGEIKLHWDGQRMLFTRADSESWKIWEIDADGTHLRQVSRMPADVDCLDPCYLPDGRIIFGSTAPVQAVPCWHGLRRVTNLYQMHADGSGVRQLCFDQDHDLHPVVLDHLLVEGASLADARYNDHVIVTAPVGSYQPNAWGLYDMHGNAAEWTLSDYRSYPYRDDDGRNDAAPTGNKVVRGGSFFAAPKRCRSAYRLSFPTWQRVFDVGFRVICETPDVVSDVVSDTLQQ